MKATAQPSREQSRAREAAPAVVHDVLRSSGRPLEPPVRAEMESRFQHDFSRVRIHADAQAAESARAVDAHAYTVGADVVFGRGRYAPTTREGRQLIAHELVHVVQQSQGGLALQRQDVGERRRRYEERVRGTPATTRPGVWSGRVERREIDEEYRRHPPAAGQPGREGWETLRNRSQGEATVVFDTNRCEVAIPSRLAFRNPTAGQLPSRDPCRTNSSAPARALPAGKFRDLQSDFAATTNERLNNWYTARIEGCAGGPCADRDIPVRVRVGPTETEGPTRTVWFINASGRSCVSGNDTFVYAPDGEVDREMWAHEGGHLFLRYGDEYREAGRPLERVRESDRSGMASRNMSRLALLHERHFAFVRAFLDSALTAAGHQGCRASLREVERPMVPSLRPSAAVGGLSTAGGRGMYVDLGFDLGVPLSRQREWELLVGLHGRALAQLEGERQLALLAGLRIGLERKFALSRFGHTLAAGAFGEVGAGIFRADTPESERGPYAEAGGYLTLHFLHHGVGSPFVGFEAATGRRTGTGQIGGGPTFEPSPQAGPTEWVRYGITAGFEF